MVVLAKRVVSDLEDDGTQTAAAPSNGTQLLRIIAPLVNQVRLVENLLRPFQTDAVFELDIMALSPIESETGRRM
jgi:hypothetical protein